jgi:hypothetical protein
MLSTSDWPSEGVESSVVSTGLSAGGMLPMFGDGKDGDVHPRDDVSGNGDAPAGLNVGVCGDAEQCQAFSGPTMACLHGPLSFSANITTLWAE